MKRHKQATSADLGRHGPFDTHEQEVVLSVLRTNDLFQHRFGQFFRSYGLTESQFNVLWLLGRAGEPLPCVEIGRRLIAVVPGVTRLVDSLEKRDLVARERSDSDRRVWRVSLTESGEELLGEMQEPNLAMHRSLVGHLGKKECEELVTLLARARSAVETTTNDPKEKP